MFEVTIPCRAFAKQRPRFNGRCAYMNAAYTQRKHSLVVLARVANKAPLPLHTGPLRLDITIRFKKLGTGDLDNLAGGILDSFNGVLWADDKQIQRGDWRIERNTGAADTITLRIEQL